MNDIEKYCASGIFGRLYYRLKFMYLGKDLETELIEHIRELTKKKEQFKADLNRNHMNVTAPVYHTVLYQGEAQKSSSSEEPSAWKKQLEREEEDNFINDVVTAAVVSSVFDAMDSGSLSDYSSSSDLGGGGDFGGGGAGGDW